jgi:hypothetical protein
MPVNQRAAKMAPRVYMAETTTPDAMTRNWSTVPATRAQAIRGRPTTPPIRTAQTARAPPTPPARARLACSSTMATGMAKPMTIASKTRTVPQSCLMPLPSVGILNRFTTARRR